MKIATIGIILSIILIAVSVYFLFLSKEKGVAPSTTTTLPPTTTTSMPSGGGERIITIREVSIYSDRFEPPQLNINANEKVKWVNKDNKQHEVVCVAGETPLFDAILNSEDMWEFYISEYTECWDPLVSEEGMRMSITVEG